MHWTHHQDMSLAEDATVVVVRGDDGWEVLPFGFDGGSSGVYPSRERAIEIAESVAGDVLCCVGHLAPDSDAP